MPLKNLRIQNLSYIYDILVDWYEIKRKTSKNSAFKNFKILKELFYKFYNNFMKRTGDPKTKSYKPKISKFVRTLYDLANVG